VVFEYIEIEANEAVKVTSKDFKTKDSIHGPYKQGSEPVLESRQPDTISQNCST
jgi:hypothetical protein